MSLGENLQRIRCTRHITQNAVAEKTGILQSSISQYENGLRTPPIEVLKKIADYYGVTLDELCKE